MARDHEDTQPPDRSGTPPVLPYQAPSDDWKPPADEVYGSVGYAALILAGIAASGAFALALMPSLPTGSSIQPAFVCCCVALPWLLSVALAVRVSLRSAGRVPAMLALLVDFLLVFALVYLKD